MPHSQSCGVCADQPPKYKCPSCELQYCSLACYKTHKSSAHADPASAPTAPPSSITTASSSASNPPAAEASAVPSAVQPPASAQQNGRAAGAALNANPTTSSSSGSSPYAPLLAHPSLAALFTRYPALRSRLARVYASTQEPDPNSPNHDSPSQHHYHHRGGRGGRGRGRGRGRGGRGDRGRGGAGVYRGGQWKQDVADRSAVKQLLRMQAWEGEEGEGVREFMALVAQIRAGETRGAEEDGHMIM